MIPNSEKIFTTRLLLRRIAQTDLKTLFEWSKSVEAYGSFLSPENLDFQELEHRFKSALFWNSNEKMYLIETRRGHPLGTIHYWLPYDKMETAIMAIKIAKVQIKLVLAT